MSITLLLISYVRKELQLSPVVKLENISDSRQFVCNKCIIDFSCGLPGCGSEDRWGIIITFAVVKICWMCGDFQHVIADLCLGIIGII